jgi:hypothetical protein
MRFSALPVLMDEIVHCASVLENHTSCLDRLAFQKVLFTYNKKPGSPPLREPGFFQLPVRRFFKLSTGILRSFRVVSGG